MTHRKFTPFIPHDPKFKRALDWLRLGGLSHLQGKRIDPFTLAPMKAGTK